MSVRFGSGVTVISSFWTMFLAVVQSKSLSMQYEDDGQLTTVFAFDGSSLAYTAVMFDASNPVPYAVAAVYSQAQNDSDLSVFHSTYQVSCNQPIGNSVIIGSLGALNATVVLSISNFQSAGTQIAAGSFVGIIVAETSFDDGSTWQQTSFSEVGGGDKINALVYGTANTAFGASIVINGGAGLVRLRVAAYTSGSCNVTLRASGINDPSLVMNTAVPTTPSPPVVSIVGGVSSGGAGLSSGIARALRMDRVGSLRVGTDTLLAHDGIEGSTVNSWLWAQAATTMTIAQATGVLTLNNAGSLATTTDAIITSNRQFPLYGHGVLKFAMKAKLTQGSTNAIVEFGFGAPVGTTAIINNGAFFRLNGATWTVVTSFNGTEAQVAELAPSAAEYYMFLIYVFDDFVRFVVEDTGGVPLTDVLIPFPTSNPAPWAVSHLPAFARVHNAAAVATAAKLAIGYFDTFLLDLNTSKPWSHQMASTGRSANIVPTTFAQATQLAAGAAPTTSTPASTTVAYATLGGEFVLNGTASSENLLGVFGYQVPAPYALHITDLTLPQPFLTTGLGATVNIQEWALMVASSNNPSTATGQRYTLGMFSAAASAGIGTVFNGLPLDLDFGTPIVVPAGQFLLILVKVISGSAAGVYRGSVLIHGYYE